MQGALQSQGRVVVVGKPRSARDPFILAPHQSLAALVAQRRATCRQLHTVARGFGVAGAVLLAASAVWGLAVLWHRRAGQGGCRLGSWVVGAVMVGGGSGWPCLQGSIRVEHMLATFACARVNSVSLATQPPPFSTVSPIPL